VLYCPVVLLVRAAAPLAVFLLPVMLLKSARLPLAVFSRPVVLFWSARTSDFAYRLQQVPDAPEVRTTVKGARRRRTTRRMRPRSRVLARHGHGNGHPYSDNDSHATASTKRQVLSHYTRLIARYSLPLLSAQNDVM